MRYLYSKTLSLLIIIFVINSVLEAQIPSGYEKGLSTISQDEIYTNLSFLASDSLKGRAAGSSECLISAMYIAEKFQQYGLKPLLPINKKFRKAAAPVLNSDENETAVDLDVEDESDYDSYFQKFTMKKTRLLENNTISLHQEYENGKSVTNYKYINDFIIQYTGPDDLSITAPVIFAGYGIDEGENDYNDYSDGKKEIDVRNKIVLIVDGFPQENDPNSSFSKSKNVLYRNIRRKAEAAQNKGALAVLVVASPFKNDPPVNFKFEKRKNIFCRDTYTIPELTSQSIPVIFITKNVASNLFNGTGKTLKAQLNEIEKTLNPQAFQLADKKLSIDINFHTELVNTQNVAGFIEGTDPVLKNEYVVFGAHYDHVGLGYYGAMDKKNAGIVHNGADDNASGTAGLIEIAEAFSKTPPKRSIIFIAFSAEENGIHGSRYYVNVQPLKPVEQTIAMINLDMISRNNDKLLWVGGAFYSEDIIKIAEEANKLVGFELLYNTGLLSMASDQAHFLRKEIPALFFFAGMHDDYHSPSDDIDKVSIKKIENTSKLAYLSGWITANSAGKPQYKRVSMEDRAEIVKESLARQRHYESSKDTESIKH